MPPFLKIAAAKSRPSVPMVYVLRHQSRYFYCHDIDMCVADFSVAKYLVFALRIRHFINWRLAKRIMSVHLRCFSQSRYHWVKLYVYRRNDFQCVTLNSPGAKALYFSEPGFVG